MEKHFEPDLSDLESKINSKTKILFINSPNNPSGAVFSKDFFDNLETLLEKYPDLYVVTDDIYDKFLYDQKPFYSIGMSKKIDSRRLIIIGGVSKSYSMTGWRIGWAAGPKKIISTMSNVQSQSTSNACSISQWASLEAISGATESETNEFISLFQKRRDVALNLSQVSMVLSASNPKELFIFFLALNIFLGKKSPSGKKLESDTDLSYDLLERKGVASVPGSAFAMPGHIRFSFVVSFDDWNEGMKESRKDCQS